MSPRGLNIASKPTDIDWESESLCRGKSLCINALDVGGVLGHYGFDVQVCETIFDLGRGVIHYD